MELEPRSALPANTIRPRLSLSTRQANSHLQIDNSIDSVNINQGYDCQGAGPNSNQKFNLFDTNNAQVNIKNLSRSDLLRLLSIFEGELQSKEIVIAVLKSEQLKRLVNPIHIHSDMASRYRQLQQSLGFLSQPRSVSGVINNNSLVITHENNNNCSVDENNKLPTTCNNVGERSCNQNLTHQVVHQKNGHAETRTYEDDEFLILNETLQLLESNPLLALSQDAMYMLDFDCDETQTRNYLNIKIHHLEHIIGQHRRYRHYMNERLHLAERRCLELSLELEFERQARRRQEQVHYESGERVFLLSQIEHYQKCLEEEREKKQQIIFTLLNDLIDEREKCNQLGQALHEEKNKTVEIMANNSSMVEGLKEENERSLIMEAELDNLGTQLQKQSETFDKERDDLKSKLDLLRTQNAELTSQVEQQRQVQTKTVNVPSRPVRSNVGNNSSAMASNVATIRSQVNSTKVPSPTRLASSTIHRSSSSSLARSSSAQSPVISRTASGGSRSESSPQRNSSSSGSSPSTRSNVSGSSSTTTGLPASRLKASPTSSGATNSARTVSGKPQVPAKPAFVTTKRASLTSTKTAVAAQVGGGTSGSTTTSPDAHQSNGAPALTKSLIGSSQTTTDA